MGQIGLKLNKYIVIVALLLLTVGAGQHGWDTYWDDLRNGERGEKWRPKRNGPT
jgi:hypothetical protein